MCLMYIDVSKAIVDGIAKLNIFIPSLTTRSPAFHSNNNLCGATQS